MKNYSNRGRKSNQTKSRPCIIVKSTASTYHTPIDLLHSIFYISRNERERKIYIRFIIQTNGYMGKTEGENTNASLRK